MATQLLFYENARPVTAKTHGDVSVRGTDYSFAANSIAVRGTELVFAAKE